VELRLFSPYIPEWFGQMKLYFLLTALFFLLRVHKGNFTENIWPWEGGGGEFKAEEIA
jgi:hypothetical protein